MRTSTTLTLLLLFASFAYPQASVHTINGVNAQTGTTYTIQPVDQTKLLTFNNASPVAVTLPAASTTNFGVGSIFTVKNLGAGIVTITPASGTIDNAANIKLSQGQGTEIYSDGTNFWTQGGAGSGGLINQISGQVPIANTSTTANSSKALVGSGLNIVTANGVLGTGSNVVTANSLPGTSASVCTDSGGTGTLTTTACPGGGGGGGGLSGQTPGQVPIANSSTTSTSSKAIVGTDAGLASAATISTTPGTITCSTANGGITTTGCSTGGVPASPNFQAQVYNSGNLASTPCFNVSAPTSSSATAKLGCDTHPIGPNPKVDITQYGARACSVVATPCATGINATTIASNTTVTLSAASTFVNGDGIVIYGVGPAISMSTPGAPTVTPSVATIGTNTGY